MIVLNQIIISANSYLLWGGGWGILDSPCPSVRLTAVSVRMITWIIFIGFQFFWYTYHLGQDLGWDWIWVSYLIKYAHNGRSCDLDIFGIPEVNFPARAFELDICKDTLGRYMILVLGFAEFQYSYFSGFFLRYSYI